MTAPRADLPLEPPTEPQPAGPSGGDVALRVVGALVAVTAAVQTGILELLLSTVRIAGHLVGVSVVLAVVANVALARFARQAVGSVWAVALPAAAWLVLMMAAATRTTEGDLLLAGNNWVGPVMIFAGSVAFAVSAVRMILKPSRMDHPRRG